MGLAQSAELPAGDYAAIAAGWRGWESAPAVLAVVWEQIPTLTEMPTTLAESDWFRLVSAFELSKLGFGVERQVWQETLSDTMSLLSEDEPDRGQVAIELTDCFVLRDSAAAKAAITTTASKCVALAGLPAARVLCRGIYELTRPDAEMMRQVLKSVPHCEYLGRLYAA